MTTLKLSDDNAKKIFEEGNPVIKDILIDSFGQDFFKITKYKKYQDIKLFEDACEVVGEDPQHAKFCAGTPDELAYKKIKVIILALNKIADPTWVCDWNNSSQPKWYPWFEYKNSGFRFGASTYTIADTGASGGSRLRLCSEEVSNYCGKQFIHLYNELLN